MKNIMLINLASRDCRCNSFPLGLAYIASSLDCYNVEIIDLNFNATDEVFEKIINKHFDVVGGHAPSLEEKEELEAEYWEIVRALRN